MSFWKIAWRNIEQRALASALTALSMALGVAVMIAVIVIYGVAVRQFDQNAQGYHLIVGGKGGSLQLVLSTVYHIGQPLYPIPYTYYQKFLPGGEFAQYTEVAIPQCLGDSYEAPNGTMFRVVGTTPDLFDKIEYGRESDGTPLRYEFQEGGRNLREAGQLRGEAFHEAAFEAVIGSIVAAQSGLELGDEIHPTHGIGPESHKHEHDGFKVVGILKPTGTANDRAVFINIEGFYRLEGHALSGDEAHHGEEAGGKADEHKHAKIEKHEHKEEAHKHDEHEHDEDAAKKQADRGHEEKTTAKPVEHEHDEKTAARHDEHKHEESAKKHEHDEKSATKHDEHDHDTKSADHKEHKHHDEAGHAEHAHEHGHDHHHHHEHATEPLPINQREVTSILVLCKNNFIPRTLDHDINKSKDRLAQSVAPAREVSLLMNSIVGPIRIVLLVLTVLVIAVAGISILVSIYNSMSERSHDIAVMRALGASRKAVMAIILVESILLSLGGGLIGVLLGHAMIGAVSPYVVERTGIALSLFEFEWQELILIPGLVVLASLVGFLPALAAYRTDVAKALAGSR